MQTKCKITIIQTKGSDRPSEKINGISKLIRTENFSETDIVVLPEMFCCPYVTSAFPEYAQPEDGEMVHLLSEIARENHIYLVGGSIPEKDETGKIYNTSFVFDRHGQIITKHRKMHLFDIDVRNGQYFKESDTLTPGDSCTVFDTEFGTMGLCICYDIRFPELFRMMVDRGAKLVFCPASFNRTTGPRHWELLFRARSVDNQIFMIGAAPAADENAEYISYGHSIAVDPWGDIIWQAGEEECFKTVSVDLQDTISVREQLPLLKHRRKELYV